MSPFAEYLWSTLRSLVRTSGGSPCRTVILAGLLNMPVRTLRWHLAQLEARGVVTRPSPKGGWLPATA